MLSEQFQGLIKTIRTGDVSQFKYFITDFREMTFLDIPDSIEFDKIEDSREKSYYLALSILLSEIKFEAFSLLVNYSDKIGFFIDPKKIPFRFKIIARLHLDGIQRGLTGRIFDIIRFFNEYNLFEKDFSNKEIDLIEEIKRNDKTLIENLADLFGNVSDSLILYSCGIMPYDLYLLYVERAKIILKDDNYSKLRGRFNISGLKRWTDWYSMYGLSVKNLGSVEQFINILQKDILSITDHPFNENKKDSNKSKKFIEFNLLYRTPFYDVVANREYREIKRHFISLENILKNKDQILNKDNYSFCSLSMVLVGGLGPEGLGFTYSTPRGEVIEICSDQKETEAIIIQFKQYLKRKFIGKLDEELLNLDINADIRGKITHYLSEILKPKILINYYSKDYILRKIKLFLYRIDEFNQKYKSKLEDVVMKINKALSLILRKIKLKDQFITRMNLVDEGKVKSEDIAKLTSLRGKSHYDILRERFFFQNEILWFFKDYKEEIEELEKKFSAF
ncbi:hypothetical protein LCGC14_1656040 [marine sediment metagenome]|uniref:Uncharacterized protein n=1 Tax=marine sediment metagenome TaxID=412755 RepID=A0A0F9IHY7_9ZZZZ